MPELPEADKTLLGQVLYRIVQTNSFLKKPEYFNVQHIIYLYKCVMMAVLQRDQCWCGQHFQ
jgi:hypothetical protein